MGAGPGMLPGVAHGRVRPAAAAFTASGALGGLVLAERHVSRRGDGGRALSRLELTAAALTGVATKEPGTYSLLRWTF